MSVVHLVDQRNVHSSVKNGDQSISCIHPIVTDQTLDVTTVAV